MSASEEIGSISVAVAVKNGNILELARTVLEFVYTDG